MQFVLKFWEKIRRGSRLSCQLNGRGYEQMAFIDQYVAVFRKRYKIRPWRKWLSRGSGFSISRSCRLSHVTRRSCLLCRCLSRSVRAASWRSVTSCVRWLPSSSSHCGTSAAERRDISVRDAGVSPCLERDVLVLRFRDGSRLPV